MKKNISQSYNFITGDKTELHYTDKYESADPEKPFLHLHFYGIQTLLLTFFQTNCNNLKGQSREIRLASK